MKKIIKKKIKKILICTIFVLGCLIFCKISPENKNFFISKFLTNSISFTKINGYYTKYFKDIAPVIIKPEEYVISDKLVVEEIKKYENFEKLSLRTNIIPAINGGLIVFIGQKENFLKTVIVQGHDGNDYWYGNLENISVNLYDYIEKNEIIGDVKENELILDIKNKEESISYEDIQN